MKRTYQQPATEVTQVTASSMLAESVTTTIRDTAATGPARVKENDWDFEWEDDDPLEP